LEFSALDEHYETRQAPDFCQAVDRHFLALNEKWLR
jgi:hypothetical protein